MKTEAWLSLFGLLTIAANLTVIGVWGVVLASRFSEAAADLRDRVTVTFGVSGLSFAALVAAVATAGSLYLSEGAHLVPCRLCWYQRIGMYPLALILIVAALRRDWGVKPYALTLALLGPVVSVYHVLVEHYPSLEGAVSCDPFNPCSVNPVKGYDFVAYGFMKSIPYMALSGFLLVATILVVADPTDDLPDERPLGYEPSAEERR
ncbi:MAG: disulfide bond formation protein B [Acidimicrobiia bacterium]|nr:disulfide bond formation protein B [Acidimicrobiia bacterium]